MKKLYWMFALALFLVAMALTPELPSRDNWTGLRMSEANAITYRRARVTYRRGYRRGARRAYYRAGYYGGAYRTGCRCY